MIRRVDEIDARWDATVQAVASATLGNPGDYKIVTLHRNQQAAKRRNRGLARLATVREDMAAHAEQKTLALVNTRPELAPVRAELDEAADLRARLVTLAEERAGFSADAPDEAPAAAVVESPFRGVAQTANAAEAKGMAAHRFHRHTWDIQGRQPVGAVRTCDRCGERQVKRQHVESRDGVRLYVQRWVTSDPSAGVPSGTSADRPHPAPGAPKEANMARKASSKGGATATARNTIDAAAKKAAPAAAPAVAQSAPAPVEAKPDPLVAMAGLEATLLAEAKKLGGTDQTKKKVYTRVRAHGKTVAYVRFPNKKGVTVFVTKTGGGDEKLSVASDADAAKVLDKIGARIADLAAAKAPKVEEPVTA